MDSQSITSFINQLSNGDQYAAEELWRHMTARLHEFAIQKLDAIPDESIKKIVLLKFQGATNGEVALELNCTTRTIERKLERIRRTWVEAGLHDVEQ